MITGIWKRGLGFLLAACFSAFSTWTMFYRFSEGTPAFLPYAASGWSVGLAYLLCLGVFVFWQVAVTDKKTVPAFVAALILSVFYAVGTFVQQDLNSLERINLLRFAFRAAGIFPVIYCVLSVFFSGLARFRKIRPMPDAAERSRIRRYLLLTLTILWLPYLIGCFPGNMTADTIKSVRSFQDPIQGQNMPWFLNLLYGGTLLLGERLGNANGALFVFCLLQALLLIFGLSSLMSQLWCLGVPKGLLIFFLLIFGIFPIFPTYAFCTMKDALFALGLVFFCDAGVGILGAQDTEKRDWMELGLSVIFTALTRNGAALMMLLSMIGFFVLFPRRRRFLITVAGLMLICNFGAPKLLGQPASQIRENLSLPIQQTARVMHLFEEDLSREETEQYKKIMTLKQWKRYKAGISDPVKKYFAEAPSNRYLKDFASLWWKEMKNHPYTYLEATVLMNYAYYVPPADRSDLKVRLFLGTERFSTEKVEELTTLTENRNPGLETIQRVYDFLDGIPVIRLFQRIGLYTWLMVIALIYGLSDPAGRKWTLLLIPELIILIGCCFSPVNGHLRYAFPFMICGPLVSGIIFFARGNDMKMWKPEKK